MHILHKGTGADIPCFHDLHFLNNYHELEMIPFDQMKASSLNETGEDSEIY
jgi:hypothetical protein